jgi:hypothetical protein
LNARSLLRSIPRLLLSVLLFLASGEAALRVIYRDQGKRTLGGPGGHDFEHLPIGKAERGRYDSGPRHPGIKRLLAVGDSITWGLGVRDWSAIWTERLAQALEQKGGPIEMAVLAEPGRNMGEHLVALEGRGSRVHPDVLIYQWYVNDIEVIGHRPQFQRAWQRSSEHEQMRKFSYLYYFLDHMASMWLPPPERSYVDYILQDFRPGSLEWAEFERAFHSFATRAQEIAPTRLMLLYPQVPFRGPYPLQPMNDRMRTLAGPHRLAIPPAAWVRLVGTMEPRSDAEWQQVVHVPAGVFGAVIETHDYYVSEGVLEVGVRLMCDSPSSLPAVVAVETVDNVTNQIVGRGNAVIDMQARGWQEPSVRIHVQDAHGHSVRIRLVSPGALGLSLASIDIPVDYGFTVVDLTEPLNAFDTHVSMFDAHPNERAHAVMAQEVLAALDRLR